MTKLFDLPDQTNYKASKLIVPRINLVNSLSAILLCLLVSCIVLLPNFKYNNWYVFITIQILGFIVAGIIYFKLEKKKKFYKHNTYYNSNLINAGIISIIICFGVGIIYWLGNLHMIWLSIVAGAAFFLPWITTFSNHAYVSIPEIQYPVWYKQNNLIDNKAFVFLASVSIKIKLSIHALDKSDKIFYSTVPAQMEVGKIFHYFLIQQQMKEIIIETENENEASYGWLFYIQSLKGYQLKPLNPNFNLWENQVKSNNTIIAKRVIKTSSDKYISSYSIKSYEQQKSR